MVIDSSALLAILLSIIRAAEWVASKCSAWEFREIIDQL
jgi:hypothetical protein